MYAVLAYDGVLITNDMRLPSALWERFFVYVRMNVRYIV